MPDPAADPILDPSMLANLHRIGGPAVLTRFIDTFLDYAPARPHSSTTFSASCKTG